MPYRSRALAVLERWREIERQLIDAPVGSSEAELLQAAALGLRDEYQALIEQALEGDLPVPPPFPGASET